MFLSITPGTSCATRCKAPPVTAALSCTKKSKPRPCTEFWAIIERDLRRFRRSPTLIIVSMIMPLVQLVVLGYAFGGKIKNMEIGVVDQDHGVPAVKLQEMFQAVAANARTFNTVSYADQETALQDLRNGKINGILNFRPIFRASAGRGQSAGRAD